MTRLLLVALIAAAVCMASAGVGAAAATGYAEGGGLVRAVDGTTMSFYDDIYNQHQKYEITE